MERFASAPGGVTAPWQSAASLPGTSPHTSPIQLCYEPPQTPLPILLSLESPHPALPGTLPTQLSHPALLQRQPTPLAPEHSPGGDCLLDSSWSPSHCIKHSTLGHFQPRFLYFIFAMNTTVRTKGSFPCTTDPSFGQKSYFLVIYHRFLSLQIFLIQI